MWIPYAETSQLDKRQTVCRQRDRFGNCIRTSSSPARWIAMGIVLFVFFFTLLVCLSISARRRRRGFMPLYGTRWIIRPPAHARNNQHAQHHQTSQNPNGGMFVHSPGARSPYEWPPTHTNPNQENTANPSWLPKYSPGNYNQDYAPPSGPPPSSSNEEYFPPPSSPPPAHSYSKH